MARTFLSRRCKPSNHPTGQKTGNQRGHEKQLSIGIWNSMMRKRFTGSMENQDGNRFKGTPSVRGGPGTNLVVAWGWGRYAPEASAGIGQRLMDPTDPPPEEARGLGPRPLHSEISALWFQADRPAPQAGAPLCSYPQISSIKGCHL
jgi:hypothetical protein